MLLLTLIGVQIFVVRVGREVIWKEEHATICFDQIRKGAFHST
jgi:hypothetical protein